MPKLVLVPIGAVAALSAFAIGVTAFGSGVAAKSLAPLPETANRTAVADSGATTALAYVYDQLGKPYQWGASGPNSFDCSGLTYAAYQREGIQIPRTSEQQWLALPHVAFASLQPGDLVFFNSGEFAAGLPGHVGIYIGKGRMIDAPHTGAVVRIEGVTAFGSFVGAARP